MPVSFLCWHLQKVATSHTFLNSSFLPQPDGALPRNSPCRLPGKLRLPLLAWEMSLLGLRAPQPLLGR